MQRRYIFICLAVISLAFFLSGNSALPVTDPVESNYALTAKEMVLSGNWISPQIYGIYWYDKPIAIYWLLSLAYTVFGFTDFASRLPGAIFGMASVVITSWYAMRRTKNTVLSILTAAMTATSLEVWAISHSIITDQLLFFFTAGTMAAIPALLASAALHNYLIKRTVRSDVGLILESGEPREVHHFCALIGYGITAINPYLALETIKELMQKKKLPKTDYTTAKNNYIKASVNGILAVMSKMGISTIHSYHDPAPQRTLPTALL